MEKARQTRLVIGSDLNDNLEMALIDVSHEFRRRVGKVEFLEAVISVGLADMGSVKAKLRGEETPSDE